MENEEIKVRRVFFVYAGLWQDKGLLAGQEERFVELAKKIKKIIGENYKQETYLVSPNFIGSTETARIIEREFNIMNRYELDPSLESNVMKAEKVLSLVKRCPYKNLVIVAHAGLVKGTPRDFVYLKTNHLMDRFSELWQIRECECLMIDLENFDPEKSVVKIKAE